MSIGSRIRERRLELGMSQAALAKKAGVSQPTISAYEIDSNRDYRLHVLYKIAAALELSPDYLKNGSGPKTLKELKGSVRDLYEAVADCNEDELAMIISVVKTIRSGRK